MSGNDYGWLTHPSNPPSTSILGSGGAVTLTAGIGASARPFVRATVGWTAGNGADVTTAIYSVTLDDPMTGETELELQCMWAGGACIVDALKAGVAEVRLTLHDQHGAPTTRFLLSGASLSASTFTMDEVRGQRCTVKMSIASFCLDPVVDVERALLTMPSEEER